MTALPQLQPDFTQSRQQEELLGFLLDLALEATAAGGASLQLPSGESLRVSLSRGPSAPAVGTLFSMAGSIAGEAWYRGKMMTGGERGPRGRQGTLFDDECSVDVLATPITRLGQSVGVLVLHHRHPGHFRRPDAATVTRLADVASNLWNGMPGPESERRARLEVRAAARLALVASSRLDELEVWHEIAQTAGALLEASSVRVATIEGTEIVCQAGVGRFAGDVGRRRPLQGGFEGLAAERIDGLLLTEWRPEPGTLPALGWIASLLCVPIRRVETVLGTITVADQTPGRFSEFDRAALLRYGLHAAAALSEARLQREELRRSEENRRAAAVASALAAASDTPGLRRAIVEELRIALGALGGRLSELVQEQPAVTAMSGEASFLDRSAASGRRELVCGHILGEAEPSHRCTLASGDGYLLAAELGHAAQHLGFVQLIRHEGTFDHTDEQFLGRLADVAAVALITRIAHIRLSQYADRIRSVAEVSARLHQSLNPHDAMAQAAEILQRALGVESLSIASVDEVWQEVAYPVFRLGEERGDGLRRPFERGFVEEVWRSGQTIFFPQNASIELQRLGLTIQGTPRTLAGVPLRTRGTVKGVIAIQDGRRDQAFEAEDVRILEIVARQLGVTLENLEAFEEERRQRITAEWLRQMARSATDPSTQPIQVLEMAADAAFQGVSGRASLVCFLPGDGTQRIIGTRGELASGIPREPQPLEGGVAGWVLGGQDAVFVTSNTAEDSRLGADERARLGAWSLVAVPVWSEYRVVAVLALAREPGSSFSVAETERLAQIADHAGAGYQTAKSTEALRQSEERYRNLISVATDAIFTLDRDGRVLSFNEAAERLWSVRSSDVLERAWEEVLLFEAREEIAAQIGRGMLGESRSFEAEVRRRDGDRRTVAMSISPLVEAGATIAVLGIVRDVTDQQRVQAQLLQAEKMSAIGQLVGGMAHEINNPLASIQVNMELLLSDARDPAQLETLQAVKTETDRAAIIVRNLLTYVRGQGSERTVVDLRETVRSAVALRRYQLLNQQIELTTQLLKDPILVWGNTINLQQVLMNLIVNAEHAIRHGPGSGHVWIRATCSEGRALLTVEDDGPGVPIGQLTRIFDPFFTTKPEGEGTGLGLSVSAGVIADHHGRLSAERRPMGGARFVIELPLHEAASEAPTVGVTVARPAPLVASGRRLLLIDDEPDIRRSISKFLSRTGWKVSLADSGEEGLRLLEGGGFDVVLCDLRMPGMSGHEFYRRLQSVDSPVVQRLVFMTGDVVSPEAQNFLAEAGRPVLPKPFTLQELVEAISQVVPL